MKQHIPIFLAGAVMLGMHELLAVEGLMRGLQVPSGYLAGWMMGVPSVFDGELVQLASSPPITVSLACGGGRLFSILLGLGAGYGCGRRWWRWVLLGPACYALTLFCNAVRITAAWHFLRFFGRALPEWALEFSHMGIGMVWSLTVVAALVWGPLRPNKEMNEVQG